jgi:hypothetical protein
LMVFCARHNDDSKSPSLSRPCLCFLLDVNTQPWERQLTAKTSLLSCTWEYSVQWVIIERKKGQPNTHRTSLALAAAGSTSIVHKHTLIFSFLPVQYIFVPFHWSCLVRQCCPGHTRHVRSLHSLEAPARLVVNNHHDVVPHDVARWTLSTTAPHPSSATAV